MTRGGGANTPRVQLLFLSRLLLRWFFQQGSESPLFLLPRIMLEQQPTEQPPRCALPSGAVLPQECRRLNVQRRIHDNASTACRRLERDFDSISHTQAPIGEKAKKRRPHKGERKPL